MKNRTIITALFCLSTGLAIAGPWPQAKGKAYLKFYTFFLNYNQHFTDGGGLDPNITTGIYTSSLYGEYGISDRFSAQWNATLFSRNIMNEEISGTTGELITPGESLNSIGDIDLGFKYALTRPGSTIPVSLSVNFGIPSGKTGGGSEGNLQTGDGEFNQSVRIDAGKGFKWSKSVNGYFSVYSGFNNRTEGFSDEFHWGLELGAQILSEKLWVITRINSVESLKNGTAAAFINSSSIFANNTEFISPSIELAYNVNKKWGFSASAGGAIRGEIIAAAPAYTFGVFIKP